MNHSQIFPNDKWHRHQMKIQSPDITRGPQDSEPLEEFLSATQAHAQDRHIRVRLGSGSVPYGFSQKKNKTGIYIYIVDYSCLVPGSLG